GGGGGGGGLASGSGEGTAPGDAGWALPRRGHGPRAGAARRRPPARGRPRRPSRGLDSVGSWGGRYASVGLQHIAAEGESLPLDPGTANPSQEGRNRSLISPMIALRG